MARLRAAALFTAALVAGAGGFVCISVSAPAPALAHGSSGGGQLPKDPQPVTKDGEKAKAEIAEVSKDPRAKQAVGSLLDKAKKALGRAHGANAAGDVDGARILSRVSLAWAKASRAALRAADVEKRADAAQAKVRELKEKVERGKALLAETEARKGQLTTEIARAEADAKKVGAGTLEKEKQRVEKTPAKKPSDKPKKEKKP
jgi:chromosome segregation ATPase